MYLFGGSNNNINDENHYFFSFDMKSLRWESINSRGEVP
jgi:hypothetical protein